MRIDQGFAGLVSGAYTLTLLLVVKGTLLLLAALGVSAVMSRASAGARHLLWLVTIVTLLLMPAVAAWAPLRVEILPPEPTPIAAPAVPRVSQNGAAQDRTMQDVAAAMAADARRADVDRRSANVGASSTAAPSRVAVLRGWLESQSSLSLLFFAWGAIAAVLLLRLAHATMQVRRIVARGTALDEPQWQAPLMEVADRIGLANTPRLLASSDTNMPFACGLITPTIVLPASCNGWSLDRRYAVLLHEVAHIERRDLVGHALGRIACALYWFHPLVWSAARRLRAESERACDDLALLSGARASDYAEHLLDIISTIRRDVTPAIAVAMARRKEFEGRMLAILDPDIRHARPNRRHAIGLTASIGAMALLVGAAAPARRVNDAAHMIAAADSVRVERAANASKAPRDASSQAATRGVPQDSVLARLSHNANSVHSPASPAAAAAPAPIASPSYRIETQARTTTSTSVNTNVSTRSGVAAVDGDSAPAARLELLAERSSPIDARVRTARQPDERATLLARVLRSDTSASLRRVAAWGLEKYADEAAAREALGTALRRDNSPRVREMSAWSLASSRGADAERALIDGLRDEDTRVRATSAWALGNLEPRGGNAADALTAALSDTSRAVSARALWALGNLDLRSAPQQVITSLRHSDPTVRSLAAWVLYNIKDPRAVSALESAMRAEPKKELQLDYLRALAATGERSVDAINRLLDSNDPAIKSMAVRALAGGQAAGPWPWPWPEPRPFP